MRFAFIVLTFATVPTLTEGGIAGGAASERFVRVADVVGKNAPFDPICDPPEHVSTCPTAHVSPDGRVIAGEREGVEAFSTNDPFIIEVPNGNRFVVEPIPK